MTVESEDGAWTARGEGHRHFVSTDDHFPSAIPRLRMTFIRPASERRIHPKT